MIVYDPRNNTEEESNNPALLAAYYIEQIAIKLSLELNTDFYRVVIDDANYFEEEVSSLTIK